MNKQYYYNIHGDSGGRASVQIDFEEAPTPEEEEIAIVNTLIGTQHFMAEQGNINFKHSLDTNAERASARPHWEEVLNAKMIHISKSEDSKHINYGMWVPGYLQDKEKVTEYAMQVREVIQVCSANRKLNRIKCPRCQQEAFDCAVNPNSINGVCRAGCGFEVDTAY